MPSSQDFNTSSESAGSQALTPSSRSSDDGCIEPASQDLKNDRNFAGPRPDSSPIRSTSNLHSSTSISSSSRPFKSSPLAHRNGPTISPAQAFTSYAHLSPTFGNDVRPHSLGSALHQADPLSSRQPHSSLQPPLQSSPSSRRALNPSPRPQMTPPTRSFWDPIPFTDQDPSESPFMGASSSSNLVEPLPRDESRKRNRESSFSLNGPSNKSLRTTPSPAATPSAALEVSDPFDYDFANDPEMASLLGGNPAEMIGEVTALQKQIEEDAIRWKRHDEESELRDREYALALQNEFNSGMSSPSSALAASYTSTPTPVNRSAPSPAAASALNGGASRKKYPVTPVRNGMMSAPSRGDASFQAPRPTQIKKESTDGMLPASKPYNLNNDNFIVIDSDDDDDDDDDDIPGRNGEPSRSNHLPSNSRPSTAHSAQSNVTIMDLTGDTPHEYLNQRQDYQMPGSWSSYDPQNQINNGYSLGASTNGYTPTAYGNGFASNSINGYHGNAGTNVYTGDGSTVPPSAFGVINQGVYGIGRALASAAANAASDIFAYGGDAGYGTTPGFTQTPNNIPGYLPVDHPFHSMDPDAHDFAGTNLGSAGHPVDVEDPLNQAYGSSNYRAQTRDEIEKHLRSLVDNIQADENLGADDRTDTPDDMADNAALYKHQIIGLKWMIKQEEGSNKGGILADDMGLGKTIQAIALMVSRRSTDPKRKTTLIVAPVALLRQWENELRIKVKPERRLTTFIYHGKARGTQWSTIRQFDVVLTTYGTLASEFRQKERLDVIKTANPNWQPLTNKDRLTLLGDECKFYRVIIDEAQNIKNRVAKTSKAVHCLRATYRFCMTGTPMMNNITELYSLIKFLEIKPYCDWDRFRRDFDRPMRGGFQVDDTMRRFQAFLKACLLRRTKKSQIDGQPIITLPERITQVDHAVFDEDQKAFYANLEGGARRTVNRYLARGTVGKNYSNILELLLRLRQACDHPHLIKNHAEKDTSALGSGADNLLKLATEALSPDAVERLKVMTFLECAICMEGAGNATIFTPCGHFTCTECFTRVSDPATADHFHDDGAGADTFKFKCIHCRGAVDPRRVTDYSSFKRGHMPEESSQEQAEPEEGVEDFDMVTDSEDDSDSEKDSDDESDGGSMGSMKEFIDDGSEEEQAGKEESDEDEEEAFFSRPQTEEEFMRRIEEGMARERQAGQETERQRGAQAAEAAVAAAAPARVKDEETDSEEVKTSTRPSRDTSSARAHGNASLKQLIKDRKAKKGKGKKAPKKKSLSVLQRESRSSVEARKKYMKLLKKRWISSAKIDKCIEILKDIGDNHLGEKTIVFSQFTTFLDLVEIPMMQRGFGYTRYDGSMSPGQRADAVEKFTNDRTTTVMLVSLKAGNAGLNLTVANHIVLLDPFWNPYIEEQAIDRAHRIGQRREVRIHRILIEETVEDRIIALQEKKRQIIEGALDEQASKSIGRLSNKDLAFLFGISHRP